MYKKAILSLVIITLHIFVYGQKKSGFKVFDGIMIEDKPHDLHKEGFSKINIIYEDSILVYHPNSKNTNHKIISENKYRKLKNQIDPKYPICIDIEGWTLYPDYLKLNVPKFISLGKRLRNDYSSSEIGFYGVLPFADFHLYSQYAQYKNKDGSSWLNPHNKNWLREWNFINNNLKSIARNDDIAFPSNYTRFKDMNLWRKITDLQLAKIKELNPNLKIYVFMWPQYYAKGSNVYGDDMEVEFWEYQLNYLYGKCDGIVLWMPPFHWKTRKKLSWDNKSPWYLATKKFIKEKGISNNIIWN